MHNNGLHILITRQNFAGGSPVLQAHTVIVIGNSCGRASILAELITAERINQNQVRGQNPFKTRRVVHIGERSAHNIHEILARNHELQISFLRLHELVIFIVHRSTNFQLKQKIINDIEPQLRIIFTQSSKVRNVDISCKLSRHILSHIKECFLAQGIHKAVAGIDRVDHLHFRQLCNGCSISAGESAQLFIKNSPRIHPTELGGVIPYINGIIYNFITVKGSGTSFSVHCEVLTFSSSHINFAQNAGVCIHRSGSSKVLPFLHNAQFPIHGIRNLTHELIINRVILQNKLI